MAGLSSGLQRPPLGGFKPAPAPAPTNTQQPAPPVSGAAPGGQYPVAPGAAPTPPGVAPTGTRYHTDPTGTMTPYTPYNSGDPNNPSFRAGSPTDLNDLAMQNMMKMFGLLKGFGTMGGPQDPLPREPVPGVPGREVPSTMADRAAMESAQFGRAKDRIGQIGGSALRSLKDRSTAGGRSGSGLEAKDAREITSGTQSELGQVVRDQAIDALDRSDQIDDRNLSTGVAQRGQDLGTRAGDMASGVQQRGQDYNAKLNPYQNPLLQMVPSLFGMFAPRY